MPHSHYSEKARWALDRLALPYREQPHAPLLHRLATLRKGGGSVPVLTHGPIRLHDSSAILAHADAVSGGGLLYPADASLRREVEALEQRFDQELGPHTRRWAYAQLLGDPALLGPVMSRGVPWIEAELLSVMMPWVLKLIRTSLRITPESAQRSLVRVRGIFQETGERLGSRRFLAGDCFTAADLTFAALAAPVLFPAGCRAAYPALDTVPAAMRDEALRLRQTGAGQFALRLFAQERG